MDLRGMANQASNTVNPNLIVTVKTSSGYVISGGQKQVATYNSPIVGPAQVQALDNSDLQQIDGLNIQGVKHAIYLNGDIEGLVRSENQAGDLITDTSGNVYLVTTVLENWGVWTKVAATLQDGS